MSLRINGCRVFENGRFVETDLSVIDGRIADHDAAEAMVFDFDHCILIPGLVDVHVHLREPGFSYKETMETGTRAAARGGYTAVCAMPNLNPVPDSLPHLTEQLDLIRQSALIDVRPYGAITIGEKGEALADMEAMAPHIAAFSDDGRGVQSRELMREAMLTAKSLGKLITAHCEDNSLLMGGYIHAGDYARAHGHKGICSESEWRPIERDLRLVEETGCAYHICHVSAKESVALIRHAKARGLNVTAETAPHYLLLNDSALEEDGRFKMNPPIRGEEDRLALIQGLIDGTIDMIATDHAPHAAHEKSGGLKDSLMGVVGIETAFPLLYTDLVKTGILPLEKLIELMHSNPMKRFGIGRDIQMGEPADFAIFDLESSYQIDPDQFLSMGKSTPFAGCTVCGECLMTVKNGEIIYRR